MPFDTPRTSINGRENPRRVRASYHDGDMDFLLYVREKGDLHLIVVPQHPETTSVPNCISVDRTIKGKPICNFTSPIANMILKGGLQNAPVVPDNDIHD